MVPIEVLQPNPLAMHRDIFQKMNLYSVMLCKASECLESISFACHKQIIAQKQRDMVTVLGWACGTAWRPTGIVQHLNSGAVCFRNGKILFPGKHQETLSCSALRITDSDHLNFYKLLPPCPLQSMETMRWSTNLWRDLVASSTVKNEDVEDQQLLRKKSILSGTDSKFVAIAVILFLSSNILPFHCMFFSPAYFDKKSSVQGP